MQGQETLRKHTHTIERTASASHGAVMDAIATLLARAGVPEDERAELLGGAFVLEAVRKHWNNGTAAAEAHQRLRQEDPELADAVEAVSPMLLGRAKARAEAADAIKALEAALFPGT